MTYGIPWDMSSLPDAYEGDQIKVSAAHTYKLRLAANVTVHAPANDLAEVRNSRVTHRPTAVATMKFGSVRFAKNSPEVAHSSC